MELWDLYRPMLRLALLLVPWAVVCGDIMTKLKRRKWHYLYNPIDYSVYCNSGGKINKEHKTAWSEFEHMIWCYDCLEDMSGSGGIFDGPIPYQGSQMIIGELCFHRYNLVKKVVEAPVMSKGKMYYRTDKALTKKLMVKEKP
jgi:hypothetical protein